MARVVPLKRHGNQEGTTLHRYVNPQQGLRRTTHNATPSSAEPESFHVPKMPRTRTRVLSGHYRRTQDDRVCRLCRYRKRASAFRRDAPLTRISYYGDWERRWLATRPMRRPFRRRALAKTAAQLLFQFSARMDCTRPCVKKACYSFRAGTLSLARLLASCTRSMVDVASSCDKTMGIPFFTA
jgi:hypothetical protein